MPTMVRIPFYFDVLTTTAASAQTVTVDFDTLPVAITSNGTTYFLEIWDMSEDVSNPGNSNSFIRAEVALHKVGGNVTDMNTGLVMKDEWRPFGGSGPTVTGTPTSDGYVVAVRSPNNNNDCRHKVIIWVSVFKF